MAKPSRLRVSSGPAENINLNMNDKTNDWVATAVGIKKVQADVVNSNTHSNPDQVGPMSEKI